MLHVVEVCTSNRCDLLLVYAWDFFDDALFAEDAIILVTHLLMSFPF